MQNAKLFVSRHFDTLAHRNILRAVCSMALRQYILPSARLFSALSSPTATTNAPTGLHSESIDQNPEDATRYRGRAKTCLPAAPSAKPQQEQQEQQQESEKSRKLNPLETLLKVYTQTSGRTDASPDRQYPFFTGLPLKPYFDR